MDGRQRSSGLPVKRGQCRVYSSIRAEATAAQGNIKQINDAVAQLDTQLQTVDKLQPARQGAYHECFPTSFRRLERLDITRPMPSAG